jgi:beta-mannosidase
VSADSILGRFVDITYAYRFAPAGHDLVVASLVNRERGELVAQDFFFPCGRPFERDSDLGVEATARRLEPGVWRVTVRTRKFAQAVAFDARGFVAEDDFFHLEPGGERTILLRGPDTALSGRVQPLNAFGPTKIVVSTS